MLEQLVADLLLQHGAGVEHHAQQADHLELAVQVGTHLLDGVDQIGHAFECEILALHRHDHAVGRAQAVERQQAQRGRAVDQHEIVVSCHRHQCLLEALLALVQSDQLDLGAGQLAIRAQHAVAAGLGVDGSFGNGRLAEQHVVDAECELALVDARTHGRIALRVEVDQQHALTDPGQSGGQVDAGGGLADAALLVGNAKDLGHGGASSNRGIAEKDGRRS